MTSTRRSRSASSGLRRRRKLSQPAFEPLPGGLEAAPSGRDFTPGNAVRRNVRYETIVLDRGRRLKRGSLGYLGTVFTLPNGNAAPGARQRQRQRQLTR
jgi:hypothetical protein